VLLAVAVAVAETKEMKVVVLAVLVALASAFLQLHLRWFIQLLLVPVAVVDLAVDLAETALLVGPVILAPKVEQF
jgi:hypothetical protein